MPNVLELSLQIMKDSLNGENNVFIKKKIKTKSNEVLNFYPGCPYRVFFFVLSKYKDILDAIFERNYAKIKQ